MKKIRWPKVGDKVQVIVDGELRTGIVRRISRTVSQVRVSSEPDPCGDGHPAGWSSWRDIDNIVIREDAA